MHLRALPAAASLVALCAGARAQPVVIKAGRLIDPARGTGACIRGSRDE